jgi:hypothetical protein
MSDNRAAAGNQTRDQLPVCDEIEKHTRGYGGRGGDIR